MLLEPSKVSACQLERWKSLIWGAHWNLPHSALSNFACQVLCFPAMSHVGLCKRSVHNDTTSCVMAFFTMYFSTQDFWKSITQFLSISFTAEAKHLEVGICHQTIHPSLTCKCLERKMKKEKERKTSVK